MHEARLSFLLFQDSGPSVSPLLLAVIAILLVILFVWLLLRELRARRAAIEEAAAREAASRKAEREAAVRSTSVAQPVSPAPAVPLPPAPQAVVPAAEPAQAETAVFAAPLGEAAPVMDNLELIEGIGPKIASILKTAGVTSFKQLAGMQPAEIMQVLTAGGIRLADPGTWPEQARLAAAGEMEALKALQDRLKAGRQA